MSEQELIDEGYAEGKKSFEYYVKEFSENFDFKKVHKAMKALDWNWFMCKDESESDMRGIPDLETIKRRAMNLLKEAYDDGFTHSTGGFSCGWDEGNMFMTFTIYEWDA